MNELWQPLNANAEKLPNKTATEKPLRCQLPLGHGTLTRLYVCGYLVDL